MRPADARRLIVIQAQATGVRDALNHPVAGGWVTVATTRGRVRYEYKPGERRDGRASTVVTTSTAWIEMRYRAGVTNAMRVVVAGQRWHIVDVQPDSRHRVLRLLCEQEQ